MGTVTRILDVCASRGGPGLRATPATAITSAPLANSAHLARHLAASAVETAPRLARELARASMDGVVLHVPLPPLMAILPVLPVRVWLLVCPSLFWLWLDWEGISSSAPSEAWGLWYRLARLRHRALLAMAAGCTAASAVGEEMNLAACWAEAEVLGVEAAATTPGVPQGVGVEVARPARAASKVSHKQPYRRIRWQ